MTRTEAIATITKHLEAADDQLLETVAAHLESKSLPTMTVGEALETLATDSQLTRSFSPHELELIAQSKEDFRLGRTRTHDESITWVDAELARRRQQRSAP